MNTDNFIELRNKLSYVLEALPLQLFQNYEFKLPFLQCFRKVKFFYSNISPLFYISINDKIIFLKIGKENNIPTNLIHNLSIKETVYIVKKILKYYKSWEKSSYFEASFYEIDNIHRFYVLCHNLDRQYRIMFEE